MDEGGSERRKLGEEILDCDECFKNGACRALKHEDAVGGYEGKSVVFLGINPHYNEAKQKYVQPLAKLESNVRLHLADRQLLLRKEAFELLDSLVSSNIKFSSAKPMLDGAARFKQTLVWLRGTPHEKRLDLSKIYDLQLLSEHTPVLGEYFSWIGRLARNQFHYEVKSRLGVLGIPYDAVIDRVVFLELYKYPTSDVTGLSSAPMDNLNGKCSKLLLQQLALLRQMNPAKRLLIVAAGKPIQQSLPDLRKQLGDSCDFLEMCSFSPSARGAWEKSLNENRHNYAPLVQALTSPAA